MTISQRRIFQPEDITLVRLAPNGASTIGNALVNFVLPTPDARILLKAAIIFYQEASQTALQIPFDTTLNGIIQWGVSLQAAEKVGAGQYMPTTNILGAGRQFPGTMQSIPFAIDTNVNNNLCGVSLDVQHGSDAVMGQFQMLLNGALAGTKGVTAVLRARWNVQAAEMCDEEWDWARAQMSPVFNVSANFF
jgi:hypothetical protein